MGETRRVTVRELTDISTRVNKLTGILKTLEIDSVVMEDAKVLLTKILDFFDSECLTGEDGLPERVIDKGMISLGKDINRWLSANK